MTSKERKKILDNHRHNILSNLSSKEPRKRIYGKIMRNACNKNMPIEVFAVIANFALDKLGRRYKYVTAKNDSA